MIDRSIRWSSAGLLFLALILGGSAQGIWGNFVLVLVALAVLAMAVWAPPTDAPRLLGRLPWIAGGLVALLIVMLVPLPPGIWAALPGRAMVARGFDLMGVPRPWLAWSLTPADSLVAMVSLIVPLAVFVAVARDPRKRPFLMLVALGAGTVLGVMLGFLQARDGGGAHWYLYRFSAFGQASGFFANSNHMGSLLLANIPFVTALAADQYASRSNISQRGLVIASAVGIGIILVFAIALNHSLAVLLLGGPVILLSLTIPPWRDPRVRKGLALVAVVALLGAVVLGATQGRFAPAGKQSSLDTRRTIWATSATAVGDFGMTGSGLGSFPKIYPHYESPAEVDTTYINHAHNDPLELIVELGLPGLVLMVAFLFWWARRVRAAWRVGEGNVYARGASIASGAILLHSLVDFPLRTAAIAAVFALSIGLLLLRIPLVRSDGRKELWDPRHVSID